MKATKKLIGSLISIKMDSPNWMSELRKMGIPEALFNPLSLASFADATLAFNFYAIEVADLFFILLTRAPLKLVLWYVSLSGAAVKWYKNNPCPRSMMSTYFALLMTGAAISAYSERKAKNAVY